MSEPVSHLPPPVSTRDDRVRGWSRYGPPLQWLLSVVLVAATLSWLLLGSHLPGESPHQPESINPARSDVEVAGSDSITVNMAAPIGKKIEIGIVEHEVTSEPLMRVTGSVIASRRPGRGGTEDYWQFNTAELLENYTALEKAAADVEFAKAQLPRIRELAKTKETALEREIERSEKLVQGGTEAARDLIAQKTSLLETRIENQKSLYEAETAIKTAQRNYTALHQRLLQTGLDPEILENATPAVDIVAAEVPEAKLGRIVIGQACEAKFFGIPDVIFEGRVSTLSPVLFSEQRTLRVLFVLHDPHDRLRPGMFSDIGLGTDPREVVRVPAASVIHVGRSDYVLVVDPREAPPPAVSDQSAADPVTNVEAERTSGRLRLQARCVTVGEMMDNRVEITHGLSAGERIVTQNAILLKPAVVSAQLAHCSIVNSQESGEVRP